MKDAIITIAIVVLLAIGFWWTRGGGGIPGGTDKKPGDAWSGGIGRPENW